MKGLILVDKPKGLTSFSAVGAIKRTAHEKRVGHTGTLDPMATGVLPILIGRATALSSLILEGDKEYIAGIKLGVTTDTDDITGEVLDIKPVNITEAQLKAVVESFLGEISQIPPMYSAIKKDGVRLYKLAREGKAVEIEPRRVKILEAEILSPLDSQNTFTVRFLVSKGTYIRSLARDIGEKSGCGATLFSLRRTRASAFGIESCVSLESLTEESIGDFVLNEELAVSHLREINVTEKQAVRFCNGGQLSLERLHSAPADFTEGEPVRVKLGQLFLGVGIADLEKKQIAIKCIINNI